jgi:hypothetical protein
MEPVDSFLCLQEPVTGLYHEPDESSSHLTYIFPLSSYVYVHIAQVIGLTRLSDQNYVHPPHTTGPTHIMLQQ